MARSFSSAKTVSAFFVKEISDAITRRGYATGLSSSSVRSGAGAANLMLKKGSEESAKISWIPDPVTGYYRPENQAKEIDAAELREMFINNKK